MTGLFTGTCRKRAAVTTFYKEFFARLPGYPQIDSNGDLQLAIYSQVSGSGVLSSDKLYSVITQASADIQLELGKCCVIRGRQLTDKFGAYHLAEH